MADPLGVGIVGAGAVATLHVDAVLRLPAARLVGVCDVDAERASNTAARAPETCRWTTSLAELLDWREVEAVVVCTPNDTHAALAGAALRTGRHVLVEKPLALDLEAIDRLAEAARSAKLVLMPAHTHRFYDYGAAVKSAIESGAVGRPHYARVTLLAGWLWGGWRSWVLDPQRSGGHVLHNGVHGIDVVAWWLDDEPVEVMAVEHRVTSPQLAIADHVELTIRFRREALAAVEFGRGLRPTTDIVREAVVTGSDGTVSVGTHGWGATVVAARGAADVGFDAQRGFDVQLAAFVRAARGGPVSVTAADGRRAVAVALAAARSVDERCPVPVAA